MVVLIPCEIYFSPDVVLYATASIGSYTNGHRVFRPATWFSLDYTRKSNSRLAEDWEFNDKLNVVPQLAASYSQGSDGLTWTFKLKPNLKFSDGTPLTSQDVVYSIDRALQPANKSVVAPLYLALIKDSDKLNAGKIKTIIGDSLLTPDPNTVVIIANKKARYFLDALCYSTI